MLLRFLLLAFFLNLVAALEETGRTRSSRIRHEVHNNSKTDPLLEVPRHSCDTDRLEYRLTKLEVQVTEKSENLRSELRESNRRLQALEWQSAEVQTTLDNFRNELGRLVETGQATARNSDGDLAENVDKLAYFVRLFNAGLKGLLIDVTQIKRNISTIANHMNSLLLNHDDLVTKPFLSNSLLEVKHHSFYHPHSPGTIPSCIRRDDLPRNCKEVQDGGKNVSGIYLIQPELASRAFMVLCDMHTRGGGWTFIHNRFEGVQDFYLDWHSYKTGFGNLGGEFWLGLEHIHQLTGSEIYELFIELVDTSLKKVHAHYSAFSIADEFEGFALKVLGGYSGDAGDSLTYHAGSKFSTKDKDQDGWPEGNCAQAHSGAWWYKGCDTSNLNGKYLKGDLAEDQLYQGMYWGEFHGAQYSLLQARIMIRPRYSDGTSLFHHDNSSDKNKK